MSEGIDILKRLSDGDETTFGNVYRDYFGMVRYLVVNNRGTEEDAQDVFQETVMIMIENCRKPSFQLTAAFHTYLYSVARNVWYAKARKNAKLDKLTDYEQYIETEVSIEEKEQTEEQLNIVEACINKLGDPCKSLLIGFYYLRSSMQKLAEELGYSNADHAKSQKYKCLQRLKKLALDESK